MSTVVKNLIVFKKHKLAIDPKGLLCSFCQQPGHTYNACLGRETIPHPALDYPYVKQLTDLKIDPNTVFTGLNLHDALEKFQVLGAALNRSNPWANSTSPTDEIAARIGYWAAIGANKQVISWLVWGLPLRFLKEPPRLDFDNHSSFTGNSWSAPEIERNKSLDRLIRVPDDFPKNIYPLGVQDKVKPDGTIKSRRTDDCRLLNIFLAKMSHKLETIEYAASLVEKDDDMFTVDLEDFYYLLKMEPSAVKYLCFRDTNEHILASTVLPMGLKPATFFTTKINRPVVKFFRILLIKIMNYIDDFFGSDKNPRAQIALEFVITVLKTLGFLVSVKKSSTTCSKLLESLGMLVDSTRKMWKIPTRKVSALTHFIHQACEEKGMTVEVLRRFNGTVNSIQLGCPLVKLFLRPFFSLIPNDTDHEKDFVPFDILLLQNLSKIAHLLVHKNGSSFEAKTPSLTMIVDTSETASGGKLRLPNGILKQDTICLPADLCGTSSTFRELWGFFRFLLLWSTDLLNVTKNDRNNCLILKIITDSKCAVAIMNNLGSPVPTCHEILVQIFETCDKLNIVPVIEWVPRDALNDVDALSKIWTNSKQFSLNPLVTDLISATWPNVESYVPVFNTLRNLLEIRKRSQTPLNVVIIHPVWRAQIWWQSLLDYRSKSIELGYYHQVFPSAPNNCPTWQFEASML